MIRPISALEVGTRRAQREASARRATNAPAGSALRANFTESVAGLPGGQIVRAAVTLQLPAAVVSQRNAPVFGDRRSWAAERAAAFRPQQEQLRAWVEQHRGAVVGTLAIAPVVYIELPASEVPALSHLNMVEELGPIETASTVEGYTGVGMRNATRSQHLVDGGFRGQSDPQVAWRVALVETRQGASFADNWIATDHVAFQTSTGASRIAVNMNCSTDPCTPATATGPGLAPSDTHGTRVAALAAGSIEDGQDLAFPGSATTAQIQRSGSAVQSQIAYYSGNHALTSLVPYSKQSLMVRTSSTCRSPSTAPTPRPSAVAPSTAAA